MIRGSIAFLFGVWFAFSGEAGANVLLDTQAGRGREITPLYFGMHFLGLVSSPGKGHVPTQWPPQSFGSVRLWDTATRWADIAPRAGEWNFDRLDYYVSAASAHHAQVTYVLGSTPRWASARPEEPCPYGLGCSAEPVRMAHWEEYVRRVVQRYRGRIHAYELWNEPNVVDNFRDRSLMKGYFFTGSVAQLVEMARIARKVLDEFDPNAILTTPGIVNAPIILNQFLEAGGKQYVQAVSYHFYSHDTGQFLLQVREIREIMRRQGVAHLPLWNSETGFEVWPQDQPLPPGAVHLNHEQAAARAAQLLVIGAAAGLDRFYYYAWDHGRSGMVTASGEHLPSYEAMERVQAWLLDATLLGCAEIERRGIRCDVEQGGRRYILAWADEAPGRRTLTLPDGWQFMAAEPLLGTQSIPVTVEKQGKLSLPLGLAPVRLVLKPDAER